MAANQPAQERMGVMLASVASLFIAAMEWLGRPGPGDFVEPDPDWYVTFNLVLHGAILVLLLLALFRLPKMTVDRPSLRMPFTIMVLVGIAAAAYVVGVDLGWV